MDSGSTVARHSDGLEIKGDIAPLSQPAASNMTKKGRQAVGRGPNKGGLCSFDMKVMDMVEHKGRTTYNKVPKHKRTAADCNYVNDEEIEGARDLTVKQRKKRKTANPSEAHTNQRSHKRKQTQHDAKELAEQCTKKLKKSKEKREATKNNKNDSLEGNTSLNEGSSLNSLRNTSSGTKKVKEGPAGWKDPSSLMQSQHDAKELAEQCTKKLKKSKEKKEATKNNKNDSLEGNTSLNEGSSLKSLRNTSSGTKKVKEGPAGWKDPSSLMQSHSDVKKLAEQRTKKRKGKKKRDKNSSKMKLHSEFLVPEKVPVNSSEETDANQDCIISQTLVLGKGKKALCGEEVSIVYTGKLQDGTVFGQSTAFEPLVFKLGHGNVIEGVDVGVVGMRVGERRKLTIPPSLGFGDVKMDNIPVNSTLEMTIELIRVVN